MSESKFRRLQDKAAGPATLINEGCKITGAVSATGDLPMGLWKGTIKATTVVVAGTVEGDIIASGRVEISDTARITGTVTADAIAVAEGAIVQGKMKTTSKADPVEFVEKRKAEKSG
jgi:cytoskeletal protein CcmA (bactofilin family)